MEPWIRNIYFAFGRGMYMSELIIVKFRTIAKPRAAYKIEWKEWPRPGDRVIEWKKEIPEFIKKISNEKLG